MRQGWGAMKLLQVMLFWISISAFAMDYASVQTSQEKKVEAIRNEEIRAVKSALSLRSHENRKAELFMRLAELYLEAYQADFLLEGRLHERALEKDPNAKFVRERTISDIRFGIGAAETILSLNVDRKKLDQVYYFLGYNYDQYGNAAKSLEYYRKLAREYPNSPFAFDAYRSMGEESFGKGNYEEALGYLEQGLKKAADLSQKARIYHKIAWCYYRQKRTDDAIQAMQKGIALAKGDQEKFLSIHEEGLRGIAVFYAESGRVDEAIDYFQKNAGGGVKGEEKLVKVLEKLGKEYERTGQTEKAKQVYAVLLQFKRTDDSSFRVAAKMVDLDIMKMNFDEAYERLQTLKIPKSDDVDTQVAIVNLKNKVLSTAVNNHERYRKMDDKKEGLKYLHVADQFYSIYLNRYATEKSEKNKIRMFLAEVKKILKNPAASAQLYKAIIQDQDQKYAKDAAQLWIGSIWEELQNLKKSGFKPGEEPTELELDFVAASDLLEQSIPDSKESLEARLRSAQILAEYPSQKPNTVARASKLVKDAPGTPQGLLAARLWLQTHPDQKAFESISANQILLANDRKSKGELQKDLMKLSRDFKINEIKNFENSQNFIEAAKRYEDIARNTKDDLEAENSYIGALNNYAQAQSSDDVFRVMKAWKQRFPKSNKLEKTAKTNATKFLIRGYYNDAAELFQGIGKQFNDFSAYITAAVLFDGGLQLAKAISVYKLALNLAPQDEERAKIYRSIAYLYAEMKDELNSFQSWKACFQFNSSLKAECGTQMGDYHLRLGDDRNAKAIFDQVLSIKNGPSAKSQYIAYAQFRLAQVQEKEMKNTPLRFYQDEAKMSQAIEKRSNEIIPLVQSYSKAQDLGGAWGIAASERFGDLNLGFAQEIDAVLKNNQIGQGFRKVLAEVSENSKKQAFEATKKAYLLALKGETLSPALPVIQDRLVDFGFKNMNRAQGARTVVKLIGVSPDGGALGKTNALEKTRARLIESQEDAGAWIDYGNLLWGTGKPGLSRVAYQYASDLKKRKADALNNLAVVDLLDKGYENWFAANQAIAKWKSILKIDSKNIAALYNLGYLFNYHRMFELSLPYFEKASVEFNKSNLHEKDLHDGIAIALHALGQISESELNFKKADQLGANPNRFVKRYIEAALSLENQAACLEAISDIPSVKELKGFEKISIDRLRVRCAK
jgi:tetratricopeptide (TPR) repeat protein